MASGMEMAAALSRLICGTREAVVMMCEELNRNSAYSAGDCSTKVLQFILLLNIA
jgi:hypothetical protein